MDANAAFRRERSAVLAFCAALDTDEWARPSAAANWSVQDVVAHLGATCRAMLTPSGAVLMRSPDLERANDALVDRRRKRRHDQVLAEYDRWSGRLCAVQPAMVRGPWSRLPIPLGGLGRFPVWMVSAAAPVFDHHTHLRFDIAPALGRPAPETDEQRMKVVLTWMIAVLACQLRSPNGPRLDGQIELTLRGPSGLTRYLTYRSVHDRAARGPAIGARISAKAADFPGWATRRSRWQDHDIHIDGDTDVASRFLSSLNIV